MGSVGWWENGSRCDNMKAVVGDRKKERPEGVVIATVETIIATILGVKLPLFETDSSPFSPPSSVESQLKTAG